MVSGQSHAWFTAESGHRSAAVGLVPQAICALGYALLLPGGDVMIKQIIGRHHFGFAGMSPPSQLAADPGNPAAKNYRPI
jgi:hypothetical protein